MSSKFKFNFNKQENSQGNFQFNNQNNILTALSVVVSGNVTNDGIAAYFYDDVCYLVYNHATNGITVVSSDDMGITFS